MVVSSREKGQVDDRPDAELDPVVDQVLGAAGQVPGYRAYRVDIDHDHPRSGR
jgi:hypothetical protein